MLRSEIIYLDKINKKVPSIWIDNICRYDLNIQTKNITNKTASYMVFHYYRYNKYNVQSHTQSVNLIELAKLRSKIVEEKTNYTCVS